MSDDLPETSTDTVEPSPNGTRAAGPASIPTTGVEGKPLEPPTWPVVGGLVAVVAAVLLALRGIRLRRQPATPSERLTEAGQALGVAAAGLGARAARRAADATEPVSKRAAEAAQPVAKRAAEAAGPVAKRAGKTAGPVAKEVAARAVSGAHDAAGLAQGAVGGASDVAQGAAGRATEAAGKVAAVAAEGAQEVASGAKSVRKAWHKFVTRLIIVVFGSIGYVLGARAGRERYEQIAAAARRARGAVTQ